MAANIRHSSETNEHYTRPDTVALVRAVLGDIDLDPASSAEANKVIRAREYFTSRTNGLDREWGGRVFLNPPGGQLGLSKKAKEANPQLAARIAAERLQWGTRSRSVAWWRKLATEFQARRVSSAIFIGFSLEILQTSQEMEGATFATPFDFTFCIPRTRLRFDGNSPTHANVIVYLGSDRAVFRRVFESVGKVVG